MRYSVHLTLVRLAAIVAAAVSGACADSLSAPRLSPVPTIIRTPPLGKLASRRAPSLDLATDCSLAVSTDPSCSEACSSIYGCGESSTGETSGGDLSSTHVANVSTVVNFTTHGITGGAQATFWGNYYKQSVTARSYRNGGLLSENTGTDESNETWTPFSGLTIVTQTIVPTGGATCGLTAGAHGVHRAETRIPWTAIPVGVKQTTSDASPKSQPTCQMADGSDAGGGGSDTGTVTCVYSLIYQGTTLISETQVYCVV